MAKNHIGKVLAFVAGAGAAAAGIAYFARYKSFHKALERDFHDFEDEDLSLIHILISKCLVNDFCLAFNLLRMDQVYRIQNHLYVGRIDVI